MAVEDVQTIVGPSVSNVNEK